MFPDTIRDLDEELLSLGPARLGLLVVLGVPRGLDGTIKSIRPDGHATLVGVFEDEIASDE